MIRIMIPGEPTAQARCRVFKRGNRICTFDPQVQLKKSLKNIVEDQIHALEGYEAPEYPHISFLFFMPIPKSLPTKHRELANMEKLRHVKKPDVDNLIKLYLDVLTGIAISDDNCVSIGNAVKIYSNNPRTIIFISYRDRIINNIDLYGVAA